VEEAGGSSVVSRFPENEDCDEEWVKKIKMCSHKHILFNQGKISEIYRSRAHGAPFSLTTFALLNMTSNDKSKTNYHRQFSPLFSSPSSLRTTTQQHYMGQ
jgi:hypothetical protein